MIASRPACTDVADEMNDRTFDHGVVMDVQCVLIVEDDAAFLKTLQTALAPRARQLRLARSVGEAKAQLDPAPDMVLLDFALPDGNAEALLPKLLEMRPLPAIIAMSGVASTGEAFRLAQTGVRAFLQKPFDLSDLASVWQLALTEPPDFAQPVRQAVGKVPLRAVEDTVREVMIGEALAISHGSRRRAAGLLSISRQTLQHILRS